MPKEESTIVKKIMESLRRTYPEAYLRKIHGNQFQHAGIPDIVGAIEGVFVGIEVKTESGRLSKIQELEGLEIIKSGSIHMVVTCPEDAILGLKEGLNRYRAKYGPRLT
jgi:hypothetical protein